MIRNWLRQLVRTDTEATAALLRVTLGVVILAHGAQKLFGWFGGYGFENTMAYFTEGMGLPTVLAAGIILAESLGAVALIAGAGGRLAALAIGGIMLGAVVTVHAEHGFFMNWFGAQAGEGFEYHLLALGLAGGVVLKGSGAWSVDAWLAKRLEGETTERQPAATPVAA